MWVYRGAPREIWWISAAVLAETAGRRRVDFEVGDRSENTFQRWYARLPAAQQYCSNRYAVSVCGVVSAGLP